MKAICTKSLENKAFKGQVFDIQHNENDTFYYILTNEGYVTIHGFEVENFKKVTDETITTLEEEKIRIEIEVRRRIKE